MKKRLVKDDIVDMVCQETGYPRRAVSVIIDSVLNSITIALSQNCAVQFLGFGLFEPKNRAKRTGRNPHTNEEVIIPARVVPSFKAGKYLKKAVTK